MCGGMCGCRSMPAFGKGMGSGWSLPVLVYACMCGLEKVGMHEDVNKGRECE